MARPQVGDRFIAQMEIVEECPDDFAYQGQFISNSRRNKFWAKLVGSPDSAKILVYFDGDFDPFIQGLEELNRKPA